MKMELVSVVIPVYNCEKYLPKCVNSVLCQTYGNLELLLIDDGSPDGAGKLCDEYGKKDRRVRVFHKENQGVSAARRMGVHQASGRYVAFIDSDDYVDPDYLEILMKRILETGADMVCENCVDEGQAIWENPRIEAPASLTVFEDMMEEYFRKKRFTHVVWGKVFRKEILDQAVYAEQRYAEDIYMMLSCLRVCRRVELLTEAGYHYVIRPGSVSMKADRTRVCQDRMKMLLYLREICENAEDNMRRKAQKEYEEELYAMVSAFCRYADKEEFRTFVNGYDQYYKLVRGESALYKRILLFLFGRFHGPVRSLFSVYHGLRGGQE